MANPIFELYRLDRDLTREQLIAALAETPRLARETIADRSAEALQRPPAAGGWSPLEALRHLRDAVQVYGMRFKWMILQDDPFLPDYAEDRWVAGSPDGPADVDALLAEMAAYRAETLRLLRALPEAGWSRRGRHEVNGPVVLEAYVRHQLAHEEQHLAQLRALAPKP